MKDTKLGKWLKFDDIASSVALYLSWGIVVIVTKLWFGVYNHYVDALIVCGLALLMYVVGSVRSSSSQRYFEYRVKKIMREQYLNEKLKHIQR